MFGAQQADPFIRFGDELELTSAAQLAGSWSFEDPDSDRTESLRFEADGVASWRPCEIRPLGKWRRFGDEYRLSSPGEPPQIIMGTDHSGLPLRVEGDTLMTSSGTLSRIRDSSESATQLVGSWSAPVSFLGDTVIDIAITKFEVNGTASYCTFYPETTLRTWKFGNAMLGVTLVGLKPAHLRRTSAAWPTPGRGSRPGRRRFVSRKTP